MTGTVFYLYLVKDCFTLQEQNWVVATEIVWLTKLKIFPIWLIPAKVFWTWCTASSLFAHRLASSEHLLHAWHCAGHWWFRDKLVVDLLLPWVPEKLAPLNRWGDWHLEPLSFPRSPPPPPEICGWNGPQSSLAPHSVPFHIMGTLQPPSEGPPGSQQDPKRGKGWRR